MKKILAVALALLLTLSLSACYGVVAPQEVPAVVEIGRDYDASFWYEYAPPEESEYAQQVYIWTDKTITDFQFIEVTYALAEDEFVLSAGDTIDSLPLLAAGQPFMTKPVLPETIPTHGIRYTDADGTRKQFGIGESGMDGSLLLIAF